MLLSWCHCTSPFPIYFVFFPMWPVSLVYIKAQRQITDWSRRKMLHPGCLQLKETDVSRGHEEPGWDRESVREAGWSPWACQSIASHGNEVQDIRRQGCSIPLASRLVQLPQMAFHDLLLLAEVSNCRCNYTGLPRTRPGRLLPSFPPPSPQGTDWHRS